MPPEVGSPGDWMRFARSDVEMARGPRRSGVLVESLCYHAQQAVEKSLKAVLLAHGIAFPRTHNVRALAELLPSAVKAPAVVEDATELSDYAVTSRYPGEYEPVTDEEYQEALRIAEEGVGWAAQATGRPQE